MDVGFRVAGGVLWALFRLDRSLEPKREVAGGCGWFGSGADAGETSHERTCGTGLPAIQSLGSVVRHRCMGFCFARLAGAVRHATVRQQSVGVERGVEQVLEKLVFFRARIASTGLASGARLVPGPLRPHVDAEIAPKVRVGLPNTIRIAHRNGNPKPHQRPSKGLTVVALCGAVLRRSRSGQPFLAMPKIWAR